MSTYNDHIQKFRNFFNDNVDDINKLIGPHQIIMSTKKNANIGDVLFSGKKFSGTQVRSNAIHPCSKRCLTCPLLALPNQITLENMTYTLYQEGSCKSEDLIYVCVCNICNDFYVGQSIIPLNKRMNNHRTHFNGKPSSSALSQHIQQDHPDMMHNHTKNYTIGILVKCNPLNLTRIEDRIIVDTRADQIHLNRYKPVKSSD